MTRQEFSSLSHPVRTKVVLKYTGQLLIALAILDMVILLASLVFGEYFITTRYLIVIPLLAVTGTLCSRLKAPSDVKPHEALVITAFIFVLSALVTTYPIMATGLTFDDALFESISAITTTGLSTIVDIEGKPTTFLFARAWMQWIGGLGIVVLIVAQLIHPGITAKRLVGIEDKGDIVAGTRLYARRIFFVYLALTAIGTTVLLVLGAGLFEAIVHVLAAVSTGGFSNYNDSIAGLGGTSLQTAVTVIAFMGAVPLFLYYMAFRHGRKKFFGNTEFHFLLVVSFLTIVLLTLSMGASGGFGTYTLTNAPLLGLSAQTTTGFAPVVVGDLDASSKMVMIVAMLIGGGIGSTAGGIKIYRLIVFLKILRLTIVRTCLPQHAFAEARLMGQQLGKNEIERAFLVILLFITVTVLSWLSFVAMGYDPLNSLFEVVSATGTVGLSTGIVDHDLPPFLKGVLCADMLMGRLEIIAFLVVFYPKTWIERKG